MQYNNDISTLGFLLIVAGFLFLVLVVVFGIKWSFEDDQLADDEVVPFEGEYAGLYDDLMQEAYLVAARLEAHRSE